MYKRQREKCTSSDDAVGHFLWLGDPVTRFRPQIWLGDRHWYIGLHTSRNLTVLDGVDALDLIFYSSLDAVSGPSRRSATIVQQVPLTRFCRQEVGAKKKLMNYFGHDNALFQPP